MSIATDLAWLMVDHCNDPGRDLDAEEFAYRTQNCGPLERDLVWSELPLWAQRRVEETVGLYDLEVEDAA